MCGNDRHWRQIMSIKGLINGLHQVWISDPWVKDHTLAIGLGGQNPAICAVELGDYLFN
jgi:hypothetical protein